MKRIFIILALAVLTLAPGAATLVAQNQVFAKYSSMKEVEYVCVSRAMLRLMGMAAGHSLKVNDVDIKSLSGKLDKVLIIECNKRSVARQMQADFDTLHGNPAYEVLMETRSGDETSVTLLNTSSDPKEFVMFVRDDEDATFIVMTGDFTAEDLASVTRQAL